MRPIIEDECILLAGMSRNPEIISDINLRRIHFSSDYPFEIYSVLRVCKTERFDEMFSTMMVEMRHKNHLSSDEFLYFVDFFATTPTMTTEKSTMLAYQRILKSYRNFQLVGQLENFDKIIDYDERVEYLSKILSDHERGSFSSIEATPLDKIEVDEFDEQYLLTGINDIDRTCHIGRNFLVMIAARPFSGKTTFACKLAMENSKKHKVLFVSMEMSKKLIAKKMFYYGPAYNQKNIFVAEISEITIPELSSMILAGGFSCVIIDQLNKISVQAKTEYERFTEAAKGLKKLANRLKVPIICLCQINRSAGESERPHIHQIKSSGSIEEEADVVIILHVPDREEKKTYAYLDKNRSCYGSGGKSTLYFNNQTNIYTE